MVVASSAPPSTGGDRERGSRGREQREGGGATASRGEGRGSGEVWGQIREQGAGCVGKKIREREVDKKIWFRGAHN